MTALTLLDKLWQRHLVCDLPGDMSLLYIDRHLVYEVTSPQAFEGLRRSARKHCLLEGLDDIGLTLQAAQQIRSYEQVRRSQEPWLFGSGVSPA